ncbi:HDOD domain-containing protein [Desulfonatronospira sp. MSAO_Bac3]|uniref:HDOD domain-containing protein n=1 Tax=Desulfonatronospira sp. MSAO_Bac3 TaxID=2293857 RepID=UPI000FF0A2AC|nr:HDOD domain-containing protein [Desulfonatronospira sp. MSAO_Bac3]RQD74396.1 MAG: HDOD domain-containing protein [Desulfonatronospira sp. MSAO_Bac3]
MGRILVDDIKPGMVLDDDVRDFNGRFLLGKGLSVQEKHLRIFKIWGVSEVTVQGDGAEQDDEPEEFSREERRKAASQILERFPHYDPQHKVSRKLLEIFILWKCRYPGGFYTSDAWHEALDNHTPPSERNRGEPVDPSVIIRDETRMPSLPDIFFQIQEAIQDPRTSARHLADIISKDQGLTSRLLKLVNSAFYGFPSQIDTISRAVAILGTRQLSMLAMGVTVLSGFKSISPDIIDMKGFWKHSLACAIGAKTLAQYRHLSNTESIFICGLLHDIGRLLMLRYFPRETLWSMHLAATEKLELARAEKKFFRQDHAQLGAAIMKNWKLPLKLEQSIRHHNSPGKSSFPIETTLVNMANVLSSGCLMGFSGEYMIPAPDLESWDALNLDPAVLLQTAKLMQSQADNLFQLFFDNK